VGVEQVDPGSDHDGDVVADGFGDRRDLRGVRQGRGLGQPVEGVDDDAVGGGDGGLVVAEVARELAGVADPGAVLVIEQVSVDGEPLRHQQPAVER
jgi:hypothetical protein